MSFSLKKDSQVLISEFIIFQLLQTVTQQSFILIFRDDFESRDDLTVFNCFRIAKTQVIIIYNTYNKINQLHNQMENHQTPSTFLLPKLKLKEPTSPNNQNKTRSSQSHHAIVSKIRNYQHSQINNYQSQHAQHQQPPQHQHQHQHQLQQYHSLSQYKLQNQSKYQSQSQAETHLQLKLERGGDREMPGSRDSNLYNVSHAQILRNSQNNQDGGDKKRSGSGGDQSLGSIKQSRSKSSCFGLGLFQYKYVSKSPEYFKKKQRSLQTLDPPSHEDVPMQQYIGQKMKKFNKDSLINLAKQGLYKNMNSNYKHRIIPKKKLHSQQHQFMYAQPYSPSAASINNQTKYSSFNPTRIGPLMHSLNRVRAPTKL